LAKNGILVRKGTVHGSKHRNIGLNNQDAKLEMDFAIPAFKKKFYLGLASDGCTGVPAYSCTEVGSNLIVVYAYRRIMDILCTGTSVVDVPKVLYPTVTEFIFDLVNKVMPPTTHWPYEFAIKDRGEWSSSMRFRNDYLAATLLGYITDLEDFVVFTAGDGFYYANDKLKVIDQNDNPDYPVISINQAGKGFDVKIFKYEDIKRFALGSDGLNKLMEDPEFVEGMFNWEKEDPFGLQYWLNITYGKKPELMKDDCTAITFERLELGG